MVDSWAARTRGTEAVLGRREVGAADSEGEQTVNGGRLKGAVGNEETAGSDE
jgi:hypothetical protein